MSNQKLGFTESFVLSGTAAAISKTRWIETIFNGKNSLNELGSSVKCTVYLKVGGNSVLALGHVAWEGGPILIFAFFYSAAPIERVKLLIQNQNELIKQGKLQHVSFCTITSSGDTYVFRIKEPPELRANDSLRLIGFRREIRHHPSLTDDKLFKKKDKANIHC